MPTISRHCLPQLYFQRNASSTSCLQNRTWLSIRLIEDPFLFTTNSTISFSSTFKMHLATSALTFLEFAGIVFALPHSADREAPAKGRFRGTINTPKQTRGTGTALLNLAYTFMTVTIDAGTPPQAQTLTFDTGSPFLLVLIATLCLIYILI